MPEGVEVKISADIIKPIMFGQTIVDAFPTTSSRYKGEDPEGHVEFKRSLGGLKCQVVDIKTKGKFMYWTFSNDWYLMSTFGMTGQWSPEAGKHPCYKLIYNDKDDGGSKAMVFNDPRHFGTIKFVNSYAMLNLKLADLGWDPLNDGMHKEWINYIASKLIKTDKPIGQMLMNQALFAGVGNYIRAEALYLTKMSPWRPSNLLKKDELQSLCQALVNVMNESYSHQGATILTYKDAYGAEGKYSSCFKVYGQKTDPLGNKIVKETDPDGRTIHWSPAVQI